MNAEKKSDTRGSPIDTEALRQSEQRCRLLMDEAKDYAIIILDTEGHVIEWNAGAQRLKGYTAQEILGAHFSRFYTPEDVEQGKPASGLMHAATDGRVETEGWRVRKNGSRFWADIVITALHDASGRLVGFSKLVRDITERKQAEEALRRCEERSRAQYKGFPVPTYTWQKQTGKNFVLVDFNDAAARFTRGGIAGLMGRTAEELFPDAPEIVEEISQCFEETKAIRREMFYQMRSTREFKYLDVSYVYVPPDQVMIHCLDITEKKFAEEAVRTSEERLRVMTASANDAIISEDASGLITQFNPAGERIFGYRAEEVVNKPATILMPERFRSPCEAGRQRFLTSGDNAIIGKTTEATGLRKDGTEFPCELSLFSCQSTEGVFFTGILRDITERKKVQEQLEQTFSLLSTTLEATADGILVVDLQGKVVRYNQKFVTIWGIPEEILATKDDSKFLDFALQQLVDPKRFLDQVRQLMNEPAAESQDELYFKDGRVFERNSKPQRRMQQIVGRVWSFHDVTLRKRAEAALLEAKEKLAVHAQALEQRVAERTSNLEATIRSLEGILYHVAHDLRAPVRAMAGITQLLLQSHSAQLDEEGRQFAEQIVAAAIRLDRLILDLLDYGRVAHNRMIINEVELEDAINGVLEQMNDPITFKKATIHVKRPLPVVKADRSLLRLVLCNLLQNALTFVAPGVLPEIHIFAETHGTYVRLSIEDNGIGIEPIYRERIFRVFERLHPGEKFPGTGIGLAIVAKALERMGGKVGVESNVNGGSRFWVELPGNNPIV